MTQLRFVDVTKRYGELAAVDDASFDVDAGSWCVVTGRNGSGKTTLLQLATAMQDPTSGAVFVADAKAGSRDARRMISFLGDSPAFFSDLSVLEHAEYVAGLFDDSDVIERATEILERLDLSHRTADLPDTFSRGMKQKTAIALALARPASVLLLDEPTRGLDEAGASTLVELLCQRNDAGTTVVTVTHEPERFARINSRRVRMSEGVVEVD
jgi:ABC-2 type transport system ATP-binding protein